MNDTLLPWSSTGVRKPHAAEDSASKTLSRRSLCFVIDTRDWAYDNIVHKIRSGLSFKYDISVFYITDFKDISDLFHQVFMVARSDIVHIFWRQIFFDLIDRTVIQRYAARYGHEPARALEAVAQRVVTATVYDHLMLDGQSVEQQREGFQFFDAYATSSPILDSIYRALPGFPAPSAVLMDGVDRSFFVPHRLERLTETDRPFVIGWVGNSSWGVLEGIVDAKGLHTIIRPAIALLNDSGIPAVERLVDRADRLRPREEVARFYHDIDVYVCASLHEGTPNPVLEAMSCGVPIVSTDVGIVWTVFGKGQREFIVARDPVAFAASLKRLLTTPGLREQLSRENLDVIGDCEWERRRALWLDFFDEACRRRAERSIQEKIALLETHFHTSRRTRKRKVRSALRRYPVLYRAAAQAYHHILTFRFFAALCRRALRTALRDSWTRGRLAVAEGTGRATSPQAGDEGIARRNSNQKGDAT